MFNLSNLESHPLASKFYELSLELEKLSASWQQTELMTELQKLQRKTERLINGSSLAYCPTAYADTTAELMREYFEKNKKDDYRRNGADNLMLGLQQIAENRYKEKPA